MNTNRACGRCIICGTIGKGQKDFICKDCGHPEKIILTCTECGSHEDVTNVDPENLRIWSGRMEKFSLGTAIVSSGCIKCSRVLPRGPTLYSVRELVA